MTEKKLKPMAVLEARARQLMLMVGFGFMALIAGLMFSTSLNFRLHDRLEVIDSTLIRFTAAVLIERLWILLVFPVLINLALRFLDLPLWRTAIIGALTGELFYAAVQFASGGMEGVFTSPARDAVRLVTLIAGVVITVWAGKQGRAWADARQKVADQAAVARKSQYDDFLKASTELADRREATAAAGAPAAIAPPIPPPTAGDGPTVPASPAPTAGEPQAVEPKPATPPLAESPIAVPPPTEPKPGS